MRLTWKPSQSPTDVARNIETLFLVTKRKQLDEAIEKLLPQITDWMKANAPWEDRTGDARASLEAVISNRAKVFLVLWFTYGPDIDYAVYLENMQAGRFSILSKTMDYWQYKIFDTFKKVYGAS